MLALLSSILMLLGCWQLIENGSLTKNKLKRSTALVLNIAALTTSIVGFGVPTGLAIYFSLFAISSLVFAFFHFNLVDSELKTQTNA